MMFTLGIPTRKFRQFKELMGIYKMTFAHPPYLSHLTRETTIVSVNANNCSQEEANKFFVDWERITTEIRETRVPFWKRKLRKLTGVLKTWFQKIKT